jgi:serine/tyrosine/threonine adenylyltransferase
MMEDQRLDFHGTFRSLTNFSPRLMQAPEGELTAFISTLLQHSAQREDRFDKEAATKQWLTWLEKYSTRIEAERSEWGTEVDKEREVAGKAANPRFILRQWLLEEVIKKVEKDSLSGRRVLAKVLHVRNFP